MNLKTDILKLLELGVSKTAISEVLRLSRQVIDYRIKYNVDFTENEKHLFYQKYQCLLK